MPKLTAIRARSEKNIIQVNSRAIMRVRTSPCECEVSGRAWRCDKVDLGQLVRVAVPVRGSVRLAEQSGGAEGDDQSTSRCPHADFVGKRQAVKIAGG